MLPMKKEIFAIAFSEKNQAEAIKEISLKIKLIFPKEINYLIVLSTPDYHPSNILKTINLTLKPQQLLGVQSPFLIFEEKVISKGVVACCINKEGMEFKSTFSKKTDPQEIESFLISSFKKLKRKDFSFFSFISSKIDPSIYLRGVRASLGKFVELLGVGFLKKYSTYTSQIINNTSEEGLINIAVKGLQINSQKLGGYTPLGKPFTITKATTDKNIIIEINNQPAIDIYKHYLEEKFKIFIKTRLFSFYPLGVHSNGSFKLLNIIDILEDGSLVCMGEVKKGDHGHIMFLDAALSLTNLEARLTPLRNNRQGLTFIINSLTRKKILGENSSEEIALVKKSLGSNSKVIGLYTDYSLFLNNKNQEDNGVETGNLLITMWE